jgi:hypothetical protein
MFCIGFYSCYWVLCVDKAGAKVTNSHVVSTPMARCCREEEIVSSPALRTHISALGIASYPLRFPKYGGKGASFHRNLSRIHYQADSLGNRRIARGYLLARITHYLCFKIVFSASNWKEIKE